MKSKICSISILILILANLVSACATGPLPVADGQVLPLAQQATITGIYGVLNGAQHFGEVWVKDNRAVVAWPQTGGWAWACLRWNCSSWLSYFKFTAQGNGSIANVKTWSDLASWLSNNGWTKLASEALPTALTGAETVSGYVQQMAGSITGFVLMVPINVNEIPSGVLEVQQ